MSEAAENPQNPGSAGYQVGYGKPPLETRYGQPGANPGNPGGLPGRPPGSSILGPLLRKLAANPNEHGEGAEAARLAETAIQGAASGQDIAGVLKLMERTDGAIEKNLNLGAGAGTSVTIRGVKVKNPPALPEAGP